MNIDETTKAAIETVAKAKVAEALGGNVLAKLVDEVMQHKNRGYGSDGLTFFDRIVRECLETTIHQTVMEVIADNEDFKTKLRAAIHEKTGTFAATVVDAFTSNDWRAQLTVNVKGD